MAFLKLPLNVSRGQLDRAEDVVKSINSAIMLLMYTPKGAAVADPDYGFVFNNQCLQNINEEQGIVYEDWRKLSGTSRNLNTYAAEFCESVKANEKRLSNVQVSMTYIREFRHIQVDLKGVITKTGDPYSFTTYFRIWN